MATQAQITAYKKAHKNQNMAGMFEAAGGDVTKLSGLHRAAYPKAKAAAPRPTTRGVTTAKKTGTMAGRGQMATVGRTAASPKPATRIAGSVAQAPRPATRGTRATGAPRPSARGVTTGGRRGRLQSTGRPGTAKTTTSRAGISRSMAPGAAIRKMGSGIKKADKAYGKAIERSDRAIIGGVKRAGKSLKRSSSRARGMFG